MRSDVAAQWLGESVRSAVGDDPDNCMDLTQRTDGADCADVACRTLAQLVIERDADAAVNIVSWRRGADARSALSTWLEQWAAGNPQGARPLAVLRHSPASATAFRAAAQELNRSLSADPSAIAAIMPSLLEAERLGCTRYYLGSAYGDESKNVDLSAEQIRSRGVAQHRRSASSTGAADLAIIVPIRAADDDPERRRNVVASIGAMAAQDLPRERYRLIVVEQDERPRCRDLIADVVDDYVFAYNPGAFNKSWALNIGVATAFSADYLCLLDADSLVERDFLSRIYDELRSGVDALLPFADLLYLDRPSTAAAIERRLLQNNGLGQLGIEGVRGFGLVDVAGFAVCLSRARYERCGGYDERYRGWGDEDNDFYRALLRTGGVARGAGRLVHLWHRRPAMVVGGVRPNSHLIGTPRPPGASGQRGRLDRYHHEKATT
jgi:hypothetical protein